MSSANCRIKVSRRARESARAPACPSPCPSIVVPPAPARLTAADFALTDSYNMIPGTFNARGVSTRDVPVNATDITRNVSLNWTMAPAFIAHDPLYPPASDPLNAHAMNLWVEIEWPLAAFVNGNVVFPATCQDEPGGTLNEDPITPTAAADFDPSRVSVSGSLMAHPVPLTRRVRYSSHLESFAPFPLVSNGGWFFSQNWWSNW